MKNQFLKKTMALALAGAMTLSMAACGNDDAGNDSQTESKQSEQQESPAESSGEASGEETPDQGSEAEAPQMEDTTIKIRVMNEFKNLDKVLAKYEEMTADDPIKSIRNSSGLQAAITKISCRRPCWTVRAAALI